MSSSSALSSSIPRGYWQVQFGCQNCHPPNWLHCHNPHHQGHFVFFKSIVAILKNVINLVWMSMCVCDMEGGSILTTCAYPRGALTLCLALEQVTNVTQKSMHPTTNCPWLWCRMESTYGISIHRLLIVRSGIPQGVCLIPFITVTSAAFTAI